MNPLDWTAGPFLALYVAAACVALLLVLVLRDQIGPGGPGNAAGLDPLHLACLAGGTRNAADTALVGLLEAGAVSFDQRQDRVVTRPSASVPTGFHPYRALIASGRREDFQAAFASHGEQLRAELVRRGLAPSDQQVSRFHMAAAAILAVPLLLGAAKALVGASRGHSIDNLLVLLLMTAVAGYVLSRAPHRTTAGNAALSRLRQEHARAARAPLEHELQLAFALAGATVLSGRDYHALFKRAGGNGGGGCGGSGCGGGGCGGCS